MKQGPRVSPRILLLAGFTAAAVGAAPLSAAGAVARLMPLGDSITDGVAVPGAYRVELWNKFVTDGLNVDFTGSLSNGPDSLVDKNHEGHSGYRIDQIAASVSGWLAAAPPDMVLLLIGTNDMIQNYQVADAPARLDSLISRIATERPGAHILVGSIPPLADAAANNRAVTYNAAIPGIVDAQRALGRNVRFVDIFSSLTVGDLYDGKHPTAEGCAKMADAWHPAVRAALTPTPLSVVLAQPAYNAALSTPGTVTLHANVSDFGGTVVRVEFYNGAEKLGETVSFPYDFGWVNPPLGPAVLSAKVFDDIGNSGESWSVPVTVSEDVNSIVFSPVADGYADKANPAANFGTSAQIKANVYPAGGLEYEGYLKFDVSGLSGAVRSAKLRLYVVNRTVDAPAVYSAENAWTESGLTWNSRPARTGGAVADLGAVPLESTVEYDVTSAVAGEGLQTFALVPQSDDGVTFSSRETLHPPELVVDSVFSTDTEPPAVALTAPADGSTLQGYVSVSADATDNVGVRLVRFYKDGAFLGESTTAPYSVSWDTSFVDNGTHTLTAVARDAAGLASTSAPVAVTVNNVDSTPPVLGPLMADVGFSSATVSWTTDEPATSQVEYGVGGSTQSTPLSPVLVTSHSVFLDGLQPGQAYQYRVFSGDAAGNLSVSTPAAFTTLSDTAPVALTFFSTEDTYVDKAKPSQNFGALSQIKVNADVPDGLEYEGYVKFNVAGLTGGVQSAKLRLRVANGTVDGPAVYPAENGWTESGLTWSNRPARTGGVIADLTATPRNTVVEYDVTSAVGGNGFYTFDLAPQSDDGVAFSSRETGDRPELVITYTPSSDSQPPEVSLTAPAGGATVSGADVTVSADASDNQGIAHVRFYVDGALLVEDPSAPYSAAWDTTLVANGTHTLTATARDAAGLTRTSTPTVVTVSNVNTTPVTLTFLPSADAYADKANPALNFGAGAQLKMNAYPAGGLEFESYVKFDLSGVAGPVQSAKLRFYVVNGTVDAPAVYLSASAWTETGLAWSNRPALAGGIVADLGAASANTLIEYDVTSAVAGDGPYSFALIPQSTDGLTLSSRETGNPPQLVVTMAPASAAAPSAVPSALGRISRAHYGSLPTGGTLLHGSPILVEVHVTGGRVPDPGSSAPAVLFVNGSPRSLRAVRPGLYSALIDPAGFQGPVRYRCRVPGSSGTSIDTPEQIIEFSDTVALAPSVDDGALWEAPDGTSFDAGFSLRWSQGAGLSGVGLRKLAPEALPWTGTPAETALSFYEIVPPGRAGADLPPPSALTLSYNDVDGADEDGDGVPDGDGWVDGTRVDERALTVYARDGDRWRDLKGEVDAKRNAVTVPIHGLTVFALASRSPLTGAQAAQRFLSPALADGINDEAAFGPEAREVTIVDVNGRDVFHATAEGGVPVLWAGVDSDGRPVSSGVYIAKIRKLDGSWAYHTLVVVK
ncbi:MAG: DNRLRE domain-containing protein [Elusimicrobia bacterium]|nr:DNRLRE domain-containing protein [Elusimicrobiota bacterium]